MDIVKALSQKRYKRFEDSGAEPHYRANNDDAHGVPEAAPSEAPRVAPSSMLRLLKTMQLSFRRTLKM